MNVVECNEGWSWYGPLETMIALINKWCDDDLMITHTASSVAMKHPSVDSSGHVAVSIE